MKPQLLLISITLLGLLMNLSFTNTLSQPDWALAILLAVVISKRKSWLWVLPLVCVHDLLLFWSPWVTLPYMVAAVMLLIYSDLRLSPGQQQRWVALIVGCLPLFVEGFSITSWLLTMMLATGLWFLFSTKREKVYVEPA